MSAIFVWMLSIGLGTATLTVTAALKLHYLHMACAAAVSVFMALAAIAEVRAAPTNDARAEISLRHLGLVWTWMALNLFVTYAFVLAWPRWMPLFIGCFMAGGLCLFLASMLRGASESNAPDALLSRLARLIAIAQLVVTGSVLLALFLETFVFQSIDTRQHGWAACNLFLFGSLALAAVSLSTLRMETAPAEAQLAIDRTASA